MFSGSSTISIKDLVVSGVHGSTGREPHDKQRFRLCINVEVDAGKAAETDSIEDAFDYKIAAAIARHVVESERHVLLERIAGRICKRICQYRHVMAVEVGIEKIDASQGCIPAFTGSMKRAPMEQSERLLPIDGERVIKCIKENGAASFAILPESYRIALLDEAGIYDYVYQDEIVGPAKVREQLSTCKSLFSGSLFLRLRDEFQAAILKALPGDPFNRPLCLNELVLQKYEKDSIGITPHRDFMQNTNLICIFILAGKGNFWLCDDRKGTNAKMLCTMPGNVIVMRAPGFLGSDFRPFHSISDITERRIVCAMRQIDLCAKK